MQPIFETFKEQDFELIDKENQKCIQCNGKNINTYINGPEDAPRILFLHGWHHFIEMHSMLINRLIKEFRVLALDLPGHGYSDAFDEYPLEVFIDAIAATLEAYNF